MKFAKPLPAVTVGTLNHKPSPNDRNAPFVFLSQWWHMSQCQKKAKQLKLTCTYCVWHMSLDLTVACESCSCGTVVVIFAPHPSTSSPPAMRSVPPVPPADGEPPESLHRFCHACCPAERPRTGVGVVLNVKGCPERLYNLPTGLDFLAVSILTLWFQCSSAAHIHPTYPPLW